MSILGDDIQPALEHLQHACRAAGIRMTHQRIEIFLALRSTEGHPDVVTVYQAVRSRIPTISLDTVYRTLWMLRDIGVISTLGPPARKVRFDSKAGRHHHFLCERCGEARDFSSRQFDELPAPDEVMNVGTVSSTHVELRGLCKNCQSARASGESEEVNG